MMYRVYVTDHVFQDLVPTRTILEAVGAEVIELHCSDSGQLPSLAADADAILTTYLPNISGAVMDGMPCLKGIVRSGIGCDTIDLSAAKARGIQVANVPDYCLEEVSDHACALALSLARKVTLSSQRIKAGDYGLNYVHPIRNLGKSVVTIVGFGRIGRRIAAKLAGFGCDLRFYDPYVEQDTAVRKVDFDTAMAESDIIILQSPATPQTHHLLNEDAFMKMKRKPVIINTARGELIDTHALEQALCCGLISGAGLDVVEGYSTYGTDFSLCQYENVILTPHSGWVSEDALVALQRLAAEELRRIVLGQPVRSNAIR